MKVPTRLDTSSKSIAYVIPFGVGVMIVTILLGFPYYLIKREMPEFHLKYAFIPCFISGLLWL
jgi:hypothetical protein